MFSISCLVPRLYEAHACVCTFHLAMACTPTYQTHTPPHVHRDLERIEAPVYSVKAHEQIVNGIDGIGGLGIGGGAPELVTGSRDGEVTKLVQLNCLCSQTFPTSSPFPFPLSSSPSSSFPSSPPSLLQEV